MLADIKSEHEDFEIEYLIPKVYTPNGVPVPRTGYRYPRGTARAVGEQEVDLRATCILQSCARQFIYLARFHLIHGVEDWVAHRLYALYGTLHRLS
jgi:hypothetical protein